MLIFNNEYDTNNNQSNDDRSVCTILIDDLLSTDKNYNNSIVEGQVVCMMFRGDYISDEKATLLAEALHNKKNTTITSIYCIRFEFSSTDGFTIFINAVCTTLQKILFTRNDFDMDLFPMDYKQVQIVSSNLKDTSCSLTRIDLSNCRMGIYGDDMYYGVFII